MRILVIADDLPPQSIGGAGILAFDQIRELRARGHEVKMLTAERASELQKTLKDFKPDVVHAHNIHKFGFAILPMVKEHSPKLFLTLRDSLAVHYGKIYPKRMARGEFDYHISLWHQLRHFWRNFNPLFRSRNRRYLTFVDKIFAPSQALATALRQNGLREVVVLHDGVRTEDFSATPEEVKEFKNQHGLVGKKVLLFAGRLGGAKGSDVAFDLIRNLSQEIPNIRLLLVGKEDNLGELKERARWKGVSDKTIFTGWLSRDSVRLAYNAADVALSLSVYLDPFPTVNLEAMAAGKPVIGTIYGGTPEAVQDGITGYIVDPLLIEQVTEKTLKLLRNGDLASSFGQAGKKRVKEEFSLEKVVDKLERVYKQH